MTGDKQQFNTLSLGGLDRVTRTNGTPLPQIQRTDLYEIPQKISPLLRYTGDKEKDQANKRQIPAIYVYNGIKGTFSASNVCFIDIDTTTGVDDIIKGRQRLFSAVNECCQIIAIQKSYSDKLHIILQIPLCQTEKEWKTETAWANEYVLHEIKRLFGYDYKEIGAWDKHNLEWWQALAVSANDIFAPGFVETEIYFKPYKERKNQFSIDTTTKPKTTTPTDKATRGTGFLFHNVGYTGDKIRINRDFHVNINGCDYSGNDLRWRLLPAIYSIFGDETDNFINSYFANPGDFRGNKKEYAPNKHFVSWLRDYFKITDVSPVLKQGEFLSKYDGVIRQYINDNPRGGIIAPTGAGKTHIITKIAKELNAVILCPYVAVVEQYKGIAKLKTLPNGAKLANTAYVGTFDKALKYDLSDKLVIIDESHILFLDTTYRDNLAYLLHDLKEKQQQRLLLVTATACDEFKILGIRNPLKFARERNTIPLYYDVVDGSAQLHEQTMINDFKARNSEFGDFDKLVIFDDITAKSLYGLFPDDSALLSSETKYTKDFVFAMTNGKLPEREKVFSTKVCFNGVNFHDGGNILAVCRFVPGVTLPQHVIQCAGRFRNPDANVTFLVLESKTREGQTVATKIDNAQRVAKVNELLVQTYGKEYGEIGELIQKGIANKRFRDNIIAGINLQVEKYTRANATRDTLLKDLRQCGYFDIRDTFGHTIKGRKTDAVKRRITAEIKKQLADGIAPKDLQIDTRLNYAVNAKNQLVKLTELQPNGKIYFSYRQLADYVATKSKNAFILSIIRDLRTIAQVREWSPEDFGKFTKSVEFLCSNHDNKRARTIIVTNAKRYVDAYMKTRQGRQLQIDWKTTAWESLPTDKPAKKIETVLKDTASERERNQRERRKKIAKRLQLVNKFNATKRIFDTAEDLRRFLVNEGYTEREYRFLTKNKKDSIYNLLNL